LSEEQIRKAVEEATEIIETGATHTGENPVSKQVSANDTDGDLDVVLTHIDAPPSLLRNDVGNRGNWVSIRLEGTQSNRDGIGARIELQTGDRTLTRIVNPYGSFQSQSTSAVHFGLGDAQYIDKLTVYWPSIRTYEYTDLQANRFYTIRESAGITGVREPSMVSP